MPPLTGIRVLDLTHVVAGPFCAMLLGDMGAEVLKIENPTAGDDTRAWGPFYQTWSTFFLGLNRSKKSVVLDLKDPGGTAALRNLIGSSDILIENFRPESLSKLGFGYDAVSSLNPKLIYCSISGYGQTGPKNDLSGYDAVMQGECGLMDVTGSPDGPPTRAGVAITDYLAGLYAMSGILLALRHRDASGEGQHVDIGLLDAMTSALALPALAYLNTGKTLSREGNRHHSLTPYETLRVSDGLVVVAVGNPRLWIQFCRAIDATELEAEPRFVTNTDRMAHRDELSDELTRRLNSWTRGKLINRLRSHSVPCGQVQTIAEALDDPQLMARDMIVEMHHPKFGTAQTLGNPIKLSRTPANVDVPPPALGEHTKSVLDELSNRAVPEQD